MIPMILTKVNCNCPVLIRVALYSLYFPILVPLSRAFLNFDQWTLSVPHMVSISLSHYGRVHYGSNQSRGTSVLFFIDIFMMIIWGKLSDSKLRKHTIWLEHWICWSNNNCDHPPFCSVALFIEFSAPNYLGMEMSHRCKFDDGIQLFASWSTTWYVWHSPPTLNALWWYVSYTLTPC